MGLQVLVEAATNQLASTKFFENVTQLKKFSLSLFI